MKEETLIKYIQGDSTPEEKENVLLWIAESTENKEEFYRLKNLWALIKVQEQGDEAQSEDVEVFIRTLQAKKAERFRINAFRLMRYAAIVVIAFLAGKIVTRHPDALPPVVKYNEVKVAAGQMAQLTLSDGTSVFINSCSSLKYPASFDARERKVMLKGEAFFTVAKNDQVPFVVETPLRSVKVLGTKFDVMAYPGARAFQTTLVEGKVAMTDNHGNDIAILKPGQQFTVDSASGKYDIKNVETNLFTSWKDGLYQFDHETLKGLAGYLERIFAVKINIKNSEIENYKFTGVISRNVPFEQIIKIIQVSSPIRYELKESHGAVTEANLYKRQ
ncbi:MAG TPA: FecR domain-containing protein [Bacteroidales bacterium]|nr:FecR domain-containing protein [Bacteroidales bacterium]